MSSSPPLTVAVVGGGITGLAAAWELVQPAPPARPGGARPLSLAVVILEAGDRLGGRIHADDFGGRPVDTGPDAFLARVPGAVELCREVGLDDELVAPATGRAWMWTRGRLRPLPEGLVLGLPTDLLGLARSGIVSPPGLLRAALDLVLPRSPTPDDATVGQLVTARFGREVHQRLVDPLLGGIHAGPSDRLSAAAVAPQLAAASRRHRSLLAGLRASTPRESGTTTPLFLSLSSGVFRLVTQLGRELVARGAVVHTNAAVTALERRADGGWLLHTDAAQVPADAVILTVPAAAAAALLEPHAPAAARALDAIDHASVALVTMAYPMAAWPNPLPGSGFLVPRIDGRLLTACTWLSQKWPHLARPGELLLRASAGRWGDDRALGLDDGVLVDRLHAELDAALGLTARPTVARVVRWPDAFPQYEAGHLERVASIESDVAGIGGLAVTGAAFRGVGIPACIEQGRRAATATRAQLPQPASRGQARAGGG